MNCLSWMRLVGVLSLASPVMAHEFLLFEHLQGGNVHAITMVTPDLAFSAEDGGRIRRWDRDTTTGSWSSVYKETGYDSRYLFRDLYFGDVQNGWACGYGGRLLRTQDGGDNWAQAPSGFLLNPHTNAPADIYSVRFVWDSLLSDWRGWAVGFDGFVAASTDGGQSWSNINVPSAFSGFDLYGLAFQPNGSGGYQIWITGDHGTILRSSDNGVTWDQQHTLTTTTCAAGNIELWDIEMYNALVGVTCGGVGTNCGVAWITVNGGQSWQPDTCFSSGGLPSPHNAWSTAYNLTIGTAPSVLSSGYASQTNLRAPAPACWNQTTDTSLSYIGHPPTFGITAMGGNALVSGLFNLVRSSNTNGQTWQNEAGIHYLRERDAACVTDQIGCVVGQGFRILRSTDGLQTFTQVHVGPNLGPNLNAVAFSPVNTKNWLAVGDLEAGEPYVVRSTNQGQSWTRVAVGGFPASTPALQEIAFHPTNLRTALVVGHGGVVLETKNLGNSFALANSGVAAGTNLESVAYTPAGDAFVVGSDAGGSAWRRANGSTTWSLVPLKDASGSTTLVVDLFAVTSGAGLVWAVGADGAIFEYDAGAGEFRAVVPTTPGYDPTEDLVGIAIHAGANETHIVIGGAKGGIRYTNGSLWTSPRSRLSATGENDVGATGLSAISIFTSPTDPDGIRGYVFGRQFQISRFASVGQSW